MISPDKKPPQENKKLNEAIVEPITTDQIDTFLVKAWQGKRDNDLGEISHLALIKISRGSLLKDPNNNLLFDNYINELKESNIIDSEGNFTQVANTFLTKGLDIPNISKLLKIEGIKITSPEFGEINIESSGKDLIKYKEVLEPLMGSWINFAIDGQAFEQSHLEKILILEYVKKVKEIEPEIFDYRAEISDAKDELIKTIPREINGITIYPKFSKIYEDDILKVTMEWDTENFYSADKINFKEIEEYNSSDEVRKRRIKKVHDFNRNARYLIGNEDTIDNYKNNGRGKENNTKRLETFLNLPRFFNNSMRDTLPRIYQLDQIIMKYYIDGPAYNAEESPILKLTQEEENQLTRDIQELEFLKSVIRKMEDKYYSECKEKLKKLDESQDLKLISDFYTNASYEYSQYRHYWKGETKTHSDKEFKTINRNIATMKSNMDSNFLKEDRFDEEKYNNTLLKVSIEAEKIKNLITIEKEKEKVLATYIASPEIQELMAKISKLEDNKTTLPYVLIKDGTETVAVISKLYGNQESCHIEDWRISIVAKDINNVTNIMNGIPFGELTREELPIYKKTNDRESKKAITEETGQSAENNLEVKKPNILLEKSGDEKGTNTLQPEKKVSWWKKGIWARDVFDWNGKKASKDKSKS